MSENPTTDAPRLLTVEEVLDAPDVEEKVIPVPEWGGTIKVAGLSLDAVMSLRAESRGTDGKPDPLRMTMLMLIASVVEPKFSPEHIERLRQKSAGAMMRVIKEVSALSGINDSALGDAERSFRAESE